MYDNILVPIDMSEQSDRAVRAAADLAKLAAGKVRLMHVKERQVIVGKGGGSFEMEEPEETEHLFQKEQNLLEELGVPVTTSLHRAQLGHVAAEIVDEATASQADVIVMGSRGRGALGHLLLGSNTYKVLHLTDRPVLVVH
jgi:nucleotide-binding universal stress UspA family protein